MAEMTREQANAVWDAIDDQRSRTADLLERLSAQDWQQPSLCRGWTVRDVAAHLTLQQQRFGDLGILILRNPRLLGSVTLNRLIRDSAVVQSHLPTEEIIDRIRGMLGSRRHNAFVTPFETLTDILVHSQDIAVPLGVELAMRPEAGVIAATRRWDTRGAWLDTVFRRLPLEGCRLVATDADWVRGKGPALEGPIGALLLLLTGRDAALDRLAGPGVDALRARQVR